MSFFAGAGERSETTMLEYLYSTQSTTPAAKKSASILMHAQVLYFWTKRLTEDATGWLQAVPGRTKSRISNQPGHPCLHAQGKHPAS
jgi:hypothetical protein